MNIHTEGTRKSDYVCSVTAGEHQVRWLFIPAKAREYVFIGVGLSVCLSVTTITKMIVDEFVICD